MTGRLFRLTECLRGILNDENNQFFNTPNTTGDPMTEIYENEGIKLLYAEGYEYFEVFGLSEDCLLYTSPSPRDRQKSRMPSSA